MKTSGWKTGCTPFLLCVVIGIVAHAQTVRWVPLTPPIGSWPTLMSLIQSRDGNFYGTARVGGASDSGTIFRITPTGQLSLIYSFCAAPPNCLNGSIPEAPLVLGTDGDLYGTTWWGGAGCEFCGTVFKITQQGELTTLHSFCTLPNCADGDTPQAGLVQGTDGNFYGTTGSTIFRITSSGIFTTLVTLGADAIFPEAALVQGIDGNFYGTTYYGGSGNCDYNGDSCGTVFKMTPDGTFTILHTFSGSDGAFPAASLVQASDGTFYGTTSGGSYTVYYQGPGTIFSITPTGDFKTLYHFCADCPDGKNPEAGLVLATDGNFYGTTRAGGDRAACYDEYDGCGTIFQFTSAGVLTTLHSFTSPVPDSARFDGQNPWGGLLQATNGRLYGTTLTGGDPSCGCGIVFNLDMGLGPFVTFVRSAAKPSQQFGILGQGLTDTSSVSLNGTPASFTVKSDTFIEATVPAGATTGYVAVTTPSGTLTSNKPFVVIP